MASENNAFKELRLFHLWLEMPRRVFVEIPDEYLDNWRKLQELYGLEEDKLLWKLIEDEINVMVSKREKDAYERIEAAIREIHKVLGEEALEQFSRHIEILAKKLIEEVRQ